MQKNFIGNPEYQQTAIFILCQQKFSVLNIRLTSLLLSVQNVPTFTFALLPGNKHVAVICICSTAAFSLLLLFVCLLCICYREFRKVLTIWVFYSKYYVNVKDLRQKIFLRVSANWKLAHILTRDLMSEGLRTVTVDVSACILMTLQQKFL